MSTKIFNLIGEINEKACGELTKFTTDVLLGSPKDNIVISINSQGGSYSSCMCMYNMLKALPNPVYTLVTGQARSMAAVLFLCTTPNKRFCLKDSTFFIHSVKVSLLENAGIKELKNTLEEIVEFNTNIKNIIKETTNIPESELHKVLLENENDFIKLNSEGMEDLGVALTIDSFDEISSHLETEEKKPNFKEKIKKVLNH